MGKKKFNKPIHGNNKMIHYKCESCSKDVWQTKSHYNREKRHFCSRSCYCEYRRNVMPMEEQHAYKGVRRAGESKQVYHRRNVKNNPETIRHLKARRYAREKGAVGSHTLEEWNEIKAKHDNRCANCKEEKKLTKDHVIPLSKGGTDYISNIQPLCKNCNSKKHNKTEHPLLLNKK